MNKKSVWAIVARREIKSNFSSITFYIIAGVYGLIATALFFVPVHFSGKLLNPGFFLMGQASLSEYFGNIPWLYSIFIPLLTMKSFSSEKEQGSMETLLTLPVRPESIVTGKFLAALVSVSFLLIPGIFSLITCCAFGSPDAGPVIAGFIAIILLILAFTSIGLFAAAIAPMQIIAFVISAAICMSLTVVLNFGLQISPSLIPFITFVSAQCHFDSMTRGVLDIRDIVYFISLAAVFFMLALFITKTKRTVR